MQEYRIPRGKVLVLYAGALALLGLFGWVFVLPFVDGSLSGEARLLLPPTALAMIVLLTRSLLSLGRGRLVLAEEEIRYQGLFFHRILKLSEIRGFREGRHSLFLIRKGRYGRGLEISKCFDDWEEIRRRLLRESVDLGLREGFPLGEAGEVPEEALQRARRTALLLNAAGTAAALWLLLFPRPYGGALLSAAALPPLTLGAVKLSGGLIRLDKKKGDPFPCALYALGVPAAALTMGSLRDFSVFAYAPLWPPVFLLTLLLLGFWLTVQKEVSLRTRKGILTGLSLGLLLFGYSFGALLSLNCSYDRSEPRFYSAAVLDKRVSTGRSTAYSLTLSPWGGREEPRRVGVSRDFYESVRETESLRVSLGKGLFGVPWFTLQKEGGSSV